MKTLRVEHTLRPTHFLVVLICAIALCLVSVGSVPSAKAKGLVWFTFCGESSCARKSSRQVTAAMLYGGRMHAAPGCGKRVHSVTAVFAPNSDQRRYLLVASRGLIGEQGRKGRVWWRQVRGPRKRVLVRAVRAAGQGVKANLDIGIDLFQRANAKSSKWHLKDDGSWTGQVTCELANQRAQHQPASLGKWAALDPGEN